MCKRIISLVVVSIFFVVGATVGPAFSESNVHPVESLVGEHLAYDVSFLWFKRLAEGSIRLERGEQPGTYLATMEARTRGFAAFVTKNRIEKYQTLMEIGPDGFLRPLLHSSHTFKGEGDQQKEKRTSYGFDYEKRQVHYHKVKYQRVDADELLPLETDGPVFDILSAFYNLRLEAFGPLDQQINLPTFHRKGVEDIVVAPVAGQESGDSKFFASKGTLCKVLVDPSVFKTNGRELYVSFDENNRLERGVIKNVIGLGDVKGVLLKVTRLAQVTE
jgi:hypothetical protein